jgi:hypothetical protein
MHKRPLSIEPKPMTRAGIFHSGARNLQSQSDGMEHLFSGITTSVLTKIGIFFGSGCILFPDQSIERARIQGHPRNQNLA